MSLNLSVDWQRLSGACWPLVAEFWPLPLGSNSGAESACWPRLHLGPIVCLTSNWEPHLAALPAVILEEETEIGVHI